MGRTRDRAVREFARPDETMTQSDLDTVPRIVLPGLGRHKARVFLFGARATSKARETSNMDSAVLPLGCLPQGAVERNPFVLA